MSVHGKISWFESEISVALEMDQIFNTESQVWGERRRGARRFIKYLNMGAMAAKWVIARLCAMAAHVFVHDPFEELFMTRTVIYSVLSDRRGN